MKSKNIKIKHHKYNLYNKKKSKGRQALGVILTIVILIALAVVGFGLGRPLMEYFQGKNNTSSEPGSAWTPSESDSSSDDSSQTTTGTSSSEPTESTPEEDITPSVLVLPTNIARSAGALGNALKTAKEDGYTGVLITLKTEDGSFLYKTDIAGIKDTDAVSGVLTAKDIAAAAADNGLTPYAKISTLKDPVSGAYIADTKFMTSDSYTWLDAAPTNGGKSWLSPFSAKTAEYLADITEELAGAGFEKIVLADTKFPPFLKADDAFLGHLPIRDEQARLDALWSVISACDTAAKTKGASIMLEMSYTEFEGAEKLSTSAEPAKDAAKLNGIEILTDFSADGANLYASAKAFAGKMNGMHSGQQYTVTVKRSGLSDTALEDISRAFTESEIIVYYE